MAIAHHARVDKRLELLLWHLADRWGRVTPNGVALPLRLTHELLADLVAAQRPSVTLSLQHLERDGRLARRDGVMYLLGDPPGDARGRRGRRRGGKSAQDPGAIGLSEAAGSGPAAPRRSTASASGGAGRPRDRSRTSSAGRHLRRPARAPGPPTG